MTSPEKENVKWGVLIAVVSSLLTALGAVSAVAVKGGELLTSVHQSEAAAKANEDAIKSHDIRIAVDEAWIQEVRQGLEKIDKKIDKLDDELKKR